MIKQFWMIFITYVQYYLYRIASSPKLFNHKQIHKLHHNWINMSYKSKEAHNEKTKNKSNWVFLLKKYGKGEENIYYHFPSKLLQKHIF